MRNLSCAVNVRRRGRSKSSGDAAAGAETIVGLRPSSLSAPAAARVLLSLILGITTGCLSYAPRVNSRQVFVSSSLARRGAPGGAWFLFNKSIDEILSNFHMGRHGAQICALAKPKMRTT